MGQRGSKKLILSSAEQTVIQKLKKGNKQAQGLPEEELQDWARSLCVKEDLIEWYLNPEFAQTIQIHDKLEQVHSKTVSGSKGGVFKSTSESESTVEPEKDAFDDIDFEIDNIKEESSMPNMKIGKKIKVKLVVAEICKSDTQKAIRKMLSPILTKIDFQQQFGMFHSALVVGPWYLEWNNSSLCIPRKCYSSAAILACDLQLPGKLGEEGFDLDDTISKVSQVIIDWNSSKAYDQRTANCQQFVDDLLHKLGINTDFKGALGEYLSNLREKGECNISFPIPAAMREKLGIKERKVTFDTHEELDKFVLQLIQQEPQFETFYPLEWGLLKSFDRAFWLRHWKMPDKTQYKPGCELGPCPFKDPSVTASIKKEWF